MFIYLDIKITKLNKWVLKGSPETMPGERSPVFGPMFLPSGPKCTLFQLQRRAATFPVIFRHPLGGNVGFAALLSYLEYPGSQSLSPVFKGPTFSESLTQTLYEESQM